LGPYIPSSPIKDLSAGLIVDGTRPGEVVNSVWNGSYLISHAGQPSNSEAEEAARTTGEVHFGSAESTDGWMDPFPVCGVAAALTDELANPAPVIIQLERNQSDLSPELTDEEMNLASAELMETAELKEIRPLVDDALDTVEDYLHQVTGNVPGSVGASTYGDSPDQTGSSEAQATGNTQARTAEESEVATTVATAECTSAHTVVYPNSSAANLLIIIENNNEQLPVMNSDATEAPGALERGNHGVTVTTGVAGTEQ